MSQQNVKRALLEGFDAGAFFARTETQYENIAFDPPADKPWCALWFLPAQPGVASLGAGGTDNAPGIFQVDLNYALNGGDKEIGDKADAIRNVFKAGSRFAYSGTEVIIRSCGRSQGRVVGSYFRVVVTIAFYAHVNR